MACKRLKAAVDIVGNNMWGHESKLTGVVRQPIYCGSTLPLFNGTLDLSITQIAPTQRSGNKNAQQSGENITCEGTVSF